MCAAKRPTSQDAQSRESYILVAFLFNFYKETYSPWSGGLGEGFTSITVLLTLGFPHFSLSR